MSNGAAKVIINSQAAAVATEFAALALEFNAAIEAGKVSDEEADEAAPVCAHALGALLAARNFYRKWKGGPK